MMRPRIIHSPAADTRGDARGEGLAARAPHSGNNGRMIPLESCWHYVRDGVKVFFSSE